LTTSLVKILNEAHKFLEETKPVKTVKFNKFFPDDNAFVTVDGRMDKDDDWQISLTIQSDTKNVINWWCSEWNYKESVAQLKAFQDAAQKTIDFITACSTQPAKAAKANATKRAAKKK
jgi:hypothetical protein